MNEKNELRLLIAQELTKQGTAKLKCARLSFWKYITIAFMLCCLGAYAVYELRDILAGMEMTSTTTTTIVEAVDGVANTGEINAGGNVGGKNNSDGNKN